jgi:hypothetical protein
MTSQNGASEQRIIEDPYKFPTEKELFKEYKEENEKEIPANSSTILF